MALTGQQYLRQLGYKVIVLKRIGFSHSWQQKTAQNSFGFSQKELDGKKSTLYISFLKMLNFEFVCNSYCKI